MPEEYIGRSVKCLGCSNVFVFGQERKEPDPTDRVDVDSDSESESLGPFISRRGADSKVPARRRFEGNETKHYEDICLLLKTIHFVFAFISGAVGVIALLAMGVAEKEALKAAGFQLFILMVLAAVGCVFGAWVWEVVSGYFVLQRQNLALLREIVANTRQPGAVPDNTKG
jgi:hypothetical protein